MSLIRRLFSQAQTESVRIKNVLNQLSQVIIFIWLAFAVSLFSPFVDKYVFWAIFIFCVIITTVFIGLYIFFSLTDPDRLQSEDFQIKRQALELIEEKGTSVPIDPASIQEISNPMRKLPPTNK